MITNSSSNSSSSTSSGGKGETSTALVRIEKDKNELMVSKKRSLRVEDFPQNMQAMTATQLRSVCAANGLLSLLPKDATKSDILDIIEDQLYGSGGDNTVVSNQKKNGKLSSSKEEESDGSEYIDEDVDDF